MFESFYKNEISFLLMENSFSILTGSNSLHFKNVFFKNTH